MSVERNRHRIYLLPNMCPPLNSTILAPPNTTCLQGQKIWTSQDVRCWYRQGKIQMLSLHVYPTQNEWWTTHARMHKKKNLHHISGGSRYTMLCKERLCNGSSLVLHLLFTMLRSFFYCSFLLTVSPPFSSIYTAVISLHLWDLWLSLYTRNIYGVCNLL